MLMDEGLDTGPILAQEATTIDEDEDAGSLGSRLAELGGSIPGKQERSSASFARLVKAEIARWSPILKAASLTTN